jgi:signal transduction histidine kinase
MSTSARTPAQNAAPEAAFGRPSEPPVPIDTGGLLLLDALRRPAWLIDADDGSVVRANSEAMALLGHRPESLAHVRSTPADPQAPASAVSEAVLPHADGGSRTVLLREREFPAGDRRLRCMCAVDVTARHAQEAALRDADRRKDELLAGIGHELRDALAPICNAMSLLDRATDPRMVETAKALMSRQLGQMVRTIDELLEVSRLTQRQAATRARALRAAARAASGGRGRTAGARRVRTGAGGAAAGPSGVAGR